MTFYALFKFIAFKFDAEKIHHFMMKLISIFPVIAYITPRVKRNARFSLESNGLSWSFPVGLAAGFDKNAQAISFFTKLGFGATEVGTITKKPQIGNPLPRIFRHPEINSLTNAMGFPNDGSTKIFNNIKNSNKKGITLGINIGKNKETSIAETPKEYAELYEKFAPEADYLVINISSPNTEGLRAFQNRDQLTPLLEKVAEKHKLNPKPLFLKIAPDLSTADVELICELVIEYELDGVIATNTSSNHNKGIGGISGQAIKERSFNIRKVVCHRLGQDPTKTIIGVGGIDSYSELREFWKMGGDFVQVYTSFIYQGPKLLVDFKKGIEKDLVKHNCKNISELLEKRELL